MKTKFQLPILKKSLNKSKDLNIVLVCPSNEGWGKSHTYGIYYPGGILAVGSKIKDFMPFWNIKIYDGELYKLSDLENILSKLDIDILGLSANTNNYQNCLYLGKRAKERGVKKVLLGGPHITAVPTQILKNRDFIDAVIVHDGERAFLEYLLRFNSGSADFSGIENLFWKDFDGEIKRNKIILPMDPPRFDDQDYSLINLSSYWKEHEKEFPDICPQFIQGFTHVGCVWRSTSGGCKFCDIPYPKNSYVPPGRFWREISGAKKLLGIKSMKDYGDCLTGNPERVRALIDARPRHLDDFEFSCYARSKEVNDLMADMLKNLNVRYAYVGFDSGSNKMLNSMRQGYSVGFNYKAAEKLTKRNINITGSLILGSEGESEETIIETEKFAHNILNYNVTQLNCAILNITPGSPFGTQLKEKYLYLKEDDVWDVFELSKLWIDTYCKVPYETIEKAARKINDLNPSSRKRYFGFVKNKEITLC